MKMPIYIIVFFIASGLTAGFCNQNALNQRQQETRFASNQLVGASPDPRFDPAEHGHPVFESDLRLYQNLNNIGLGCVVKHCRDQHYWP